MVPSITARLTADLTRWRSSPNMAVKFRVCFCTATYFSVRPTGSTNTSRHCLQNKSAATCCLIFGSSLESTHPRHFSFTQIKQVADQCGARIIFTCLTRDVENVFRATRFFSDIVVAPNLDAALESCENAIIEAHHTDDSDTGTLREWFTEAFGG